MAKYTFKYWFEWGFFHEDICPCLWASDEVTKEKYGYCVALKSLPISDELRKFLFELGQVHDEFLDWSGESESLLWNDEEKQDFYHKAQEGYDRLVKELGENYTVINSEKE